MICYACGNEVKDGDVIRHKIGDTWYCLCMECRRKVNRKLVQVMEAIYIFKTDPDVGGPNDPLEFDDYRDLELLGLYHANLA